MAQVISSIIAMPASSSGVKKRSAVDAAGEAELLRRRNAELERELAGLRGELDAARRRAETAEQGEEQLCVQLGEAEADAFELACAYQSHVEELARELAAASAGVPARS
ncbi:protein RESPONSE TO LOW SULFUR 2-like [Phragmites australis]|uniref:protein RESPONSE TO LOW SULFUR 2-like n=1 Tax=Phragmites australis TaxID=29695 RepID=UPI002D76EF8B|nr:protein RESPONSE TO LOW SULFUR 2-like [Phragmites australis]